MKIKLSYILGLLAGLLTLSSCVDAIAPDLKEGVQVVRYLSAKRQILRSSFTVVYPEAKPSDFVNWMFSEIGAAEWPDSEAYAELYPIVREQAQSIGAPLIPRDVQIVPLNPKVEMEKQVVVKFDDGRGVIIVEGYLDPREPPILVQEWKLPTMHPRPS